MPALATLATLILLAGPAGQAPKPQPDPLKGTVGVCIRWGEDPDHVQEAVVVVSSGNPILDQVTPDTVRNMAWPRPTESSYAGGWVGVNLAVAGDTSVRPLPSCASLKQPKAATEPTV
ncbi:hypothetical protein ASD21_05005 [Caulobacter sp. Root1455]|uniref:hypothetical protein n=1 Tax=Caulobacter sp. Root1455 TaxID=1736465 RepID=UPI0006F67063|nr:hypothetical protein [Caulobacter sp. Root1455]KQY95871.1 hypothetical protein ASD21_05005 [Caulobacter sp. Root1455]